MPDQDIIVGVFGKDIKLIDELKYNLGERALNLYNLNNPKEPINLKWVCKNTVIIHYYGRNKPWKKNYIGILNCFYEKVQKKMKSEKSGRVLVLSCGTGGGHNSAAKAIRENLIEKGIQTDFAEYLDIINSKTKDRVNNLYLATTRGNGEVFKVVYKLGEMYQKTNLKSPVYGLNILNKNKLYKYIKDNKYEFIITTHLFAAQTLTAIQKEHPIKFMAIATDYVCIPFWEEAKHNYCIIPNKALEEDFIKKGLNKEILYPLGIPTAKAFRKDYNKNNIKESLGLDINKNYVLVLTGSMGFGNVVDIIKGLLEQIEDICFIVSCGNNKELLESLRKDYKENDRIIALPFTNNLAEYMKCSEIVLSKPGGLTTTEIATVRKPLIHTMPIPGCENYNANFFSSRGMSLKSESVDEVLKNAKDLLKDLDLQKEMIKNQEKYISRTTCDDISNIIIKEIGLENKNDD